MNNHKRVFRLAFASISIAIIVFICIGFCAFHNNIGSSDSAYTWITFISTIGAIGSMLFTGLNVWVFFTVNSTVEEQKEFYRKQELQKVVANRFYHNISNIFIPDEDGHPSCGVKRECLTAANDWFEKIKKYGTILPTLRSEEYISFVNEFKEFCINSALATNDETIFQGREDEVAYQLYLKMRDISSKLTDDIEDIQ